MNFFLGEENIHPKKKALVLSVQNLSLSKEEEALHQPLCDLLRE